MAKELNVYVVYRDIIEQQIQADWSNFSLILFNLISNAVKFNRKNGEIYLILTKKKYNKNKFA